MTQELTDEEMHALVALHDALMLGGNTSTSENVHVSARLVELGLVAYDAAGTPMITAPGQRAIDERGRDH